MKDAPGFNVSSSPPALYSYEGQQLSPYSAASLMYLPPEIKMTCTYQLTTGHESFLDIVPQTSSESTPLIALMSFDDETVRRPFVTKVLTNLWEFAIICFIYFNWRRPWNIVGLVVVTLSLPYMVGTIASFHNTTDVVITMGATLTISVAIIAFTAQTYDFTVWYGVLLILAVDVIMFGFLHVLLLLHH
ncbi:hypothetical protein ABVT39_006548 [Epinephelus coioides]